MQGWGLPAFGFPAFRIVPGTPSPIQTHRETSHIRLVALILARSSRSIRPLRWRHGPYARIWVDVVILTFIRASAMLPAMTSLRQTGYGMLSAYANLCQPKNDFPSISIRRARESSSKSIQRIAGKKS